MNHQHSMQHLTALLPKAVELLAHHEAGTRNAVAQAMSEFGGDAAPYVPNLHEALVRESNVMTRQSLEGAVKSITP